VNFKKLIKYILRFFVIQATAISFSIWYFDSFLIINTSDKFNIYLNLIEDWNRFYSFIPESLITVDLFLFLQIFIFISVVFTTKFYTYVNELKVTLDKNYLGDFTRLYLLWTTYMFSTFYFLRFNGLSRSSLIIYTVFIPLILFIFRNTEVLSHILGRSPLKETFISFNLSDQSSLNNLRILNFRKQIASLKNDINAEYKNIIKSIDELNKKNEINLIVINIYSGQQLPKELESYLINLNKKILLFSEKKLSFHTKFLHRFEEIENKNIYYFNNDIQYGSKYIIKRIVDIFLSILALLAFSPLIIYISASIMYKDGRPFVIKQKRVGLHGKKFNMYKFRTMKINSHDLRTDLQELNKKTGPLFKLDDDPRLLPGAQRLRKYSIDELPQLLNVIKGEMSIVGPRPLFEEDTILFDENYMRRLNVLPGMTGLLQINDRNTDDFDTWFKYDLEYIENWNLYLDLIIILKTIPSMFKRANSGL
tara:strand:+ start:21998 stop:23434 length:1437 start_codon:yes stop_codon:yes gene_type:complete